jgi:hypothetical protein
MELEIWHPTDETLTGPGGFLVPLRFLLKR